MLKNSSKGRQSPVKVPRTSAGDMPASRKMLKLVRNELKEDIKQLRAEVRGEFVQVRGELAQFRGVLAQFRGELTQVRIGMTKEISEVKAMVHRTNLLVEEQNANNRIVLEGLQAVWQRQERIEGYR